MINTDTSQTTTPTALQLFSPNIPRDPDTGKYIVRIDATSTRYSVCFRKFWLNTLCGYRTPLMANDIEFGLAFHIFMKELETSNGALAPSLEKAQDYFSTKPQFVKPNKTHLTREYLAEVCVKYATEVYSKDSLKTVKISDQPLVEHNFAIPVAITDYAEYILCGTIDRIVRAGDSIALLDYKTTGQYAKRAVNFFLEKELSNQLLTYTIALRLLASEYLDTELGELFKHSPKCLIEGIFIPSGVTIEFKRSRFISFTDEQLDEWMWSLNLLIKKIDAVFSGLGKIDREGMFNGSCTEKFGDLCPFFNACAAPDDRAGAYILNKGFISIPYDPLNFSKPISLEDLAYSSAKR